MLKDPMVELFVHETNRLIEQLENIIIDSEREGTIDSAINEIFRVMHTIKGNSMMMQYSGIANTSHALEDMFDYLRTEKPGNVDNNKITDLVLEAVDYIKFETSKILNEEELVENDDLQNKIKDHLESMKFMNSAAIHNNDSQLTTKLVEKIAAEAVEEIAVSNTSDLEINYYIAVVYYQENTEMVNVRAFSVVNQLEEIAIETNYRPKDLDNEKSRDIIKQEGLTLAFASEQAYEEVSSFFTRIAFMDKLELSKVTNDDYYSFVAELNAESKVVVNVESSQKKESLKDEKKSKVESTGVKKSNTLEQQYISVKISKLDLLMNLVSELVVSEAMVTRNPELENLKLDNFRKSAKHMKKIMNDLQDVVMEIRMVPLSLTFQKMNRLARDMSNKTSKKINLELLGQETEVDKNIIEHISDPIMHLVRNAIDHGIEDSESREQKGKNPVGKVVLEAKHSGGEILIIVRDDGKGLDKDRILKKAEERGLLYKDKEEYTDDEAYHLIFNAGFSTRNNITGFSGRGVGMDVVAKGIEKIGGKIQLRSEIDVGTEVTIRIPLTLAIIDCILVQVGEAKYAVPITSIKQSFEIKQDDIIKDPDGHEMLMVMDNCLKLIRVHDIHQVSTEITNVEDGIIVLIENNDKSACIFVDKLVGEYQLVVKNFSNYIGKVQGISGCALLGNGDISLILDPIEMINI